MRAPAAFLLALAVPLGDCSGCGGAEAEDTGVTIDTGTTCGVTIVSTVPADGATDADWRAPIEFHLSAASSALIHTDIPGWQQTDGDVVYWHLEAPLTPETTYTASITTCAGESALTFATSALGEPLAEAPSGQVYAMTISEGRVVAPAGVGEVLASTLAYPNLLAFTATEDGALTLVQGFGTVGGRDTDQDTCLATNTSDVDFSDTPWFVSDPASFDFRLDGSWSHLYAARIEGTFAPDGASVGGLVLSGQVRAAAWGTAFGVSEEDVCELLASFGDTCVPCIHDAFDRCIDVRIDQLHADLVDGYVLTEVADDDCPNCASGAPECPE